MKDSTNLKKISLPAMIIFLLLFCATVTAAPDEQEEPNAGTIVQEEPNANNAEVLTTLEQRMQKKISVDFSETSIDDVIRIMAEQANVDVVKSPKVTGTVTAKLTDIPLEEALRNILVSQGYDYVMSKNVIRVALSSEITQETEKLVSKIYRITYADIKEVEKSLSKFISQRGSISANSGTSNIIVTDTESKIKAIDTFIEEIDRITPQILVEARIYDITSRDRLDLGVEWNFGGRTTYYDGDGATVSTPTSAMGTNPGAKTGPFSTGVFTGATGKTSATTGAFRFGWLDASVDIDVLIKAQKNLINAKLLANPRVLVLDNERANIKIVTEIPYQQVSETSGGGSIGSVQFREVGVELEVTPHLTRDQMIRLRLKPKFSVKTDEVVVAGASDASHQYPQPVIDKREADTMLLVGNGKTVILGGLRKRQVAHQINKIPLLGDIPLVCYLFRYEGEDTTNSELVVFVTPWIVKDQAFSAVEKKQYDATEFTGPNPIITKAEKKPDTDNN